MKILVKILSVLVLITAVACSRSSENKNHADHEGHKKEETSSHAEEHKEDNDHEHEEDHDSDHQHEKEENEKDDHGHGHEEGSKAVGPGKAIEMIDEKKGFKLNAAAESLMHLKFVDITQLPVKVNKEALVIAKNEIGVYRARQSFYKFIPLKKDARGEYSLSQGEFAVGDKLVTAGLDLLRISDVFSQDKSDYGHSH